MGAALQHVHCVQSLETLEGGGLGAAALSLHASLKALGHASHLLTTRAREQPGHPAVESFVRIGPRRAFYAPGFARRTRTLADCGTTVFHQHGFYAYTSAVCGSTARRTGRPLVCHPQGMFDPWILQRSPWKKLAAQLLYENANFRHARLWRALTDKEADQIRARGIRAPIGVWPNGIDLEEYDCAMPAGSGTDERRTLLFLGRLHPKKGIDLLLGAWSKLGPLRTGWRLVLAGPDEADYLATVRMLIRTHNEQDSVTTPGLLIGAAKRAALRDADAFVLCSYSEGLPMAVLEAMASALPVVVSDQCNLPSIASQGCGWTCSANEESLLDALKSLMRADAKELRQRGAAGRALVARAYDSRKIAQELHHAVTALIS